MKFWPIFLTKIFGPNFSQGILATFLAIFSGQNLNQNLCLNFRPHFGPNFEPNFVAIFVKILSKICTIFWSIFVGQILGKFCFKSLDARITLTQFRAQPQTFKILEMLWQSSGLNPKPLKNLNLGQHLVRVSAF